MQGDVNAYRATATGTLFNGRTRLKGVVLTGTVGAGSAIFRDGGAGGTIVLQLDLLANAEKDIMVPGEGILCNTDLHVTLSGIASAVAFCG